MAIQKDKLNYKITYTICLFLDEANSLVPVIEDPGAGPVPFDSDIADRIVV